MFITIRPARVSAGFAALALSITALTIGTGPVAAGSHLVTDEASLLAEIAEANADPTIGRIEFAPGIEIEVTQPAVYTGEQNLVIDGNGATLVGDAEAAQDHGTALFEFRTDANITVRDISIEDSFGNGIGVYLPGDAIGWTRYSFTDVTVRAATFHGIFIDGQSSSGYNTDDVPHPQCTDPHPVEGSGSLWLNLNRVTVLDAGSLPEDFDDSTATGCPRDFDGLRVDEGADGNIRADILTSRFEGNLADGIELDETGEGSVVARVFRTIVNDNGDSGLTADELEDLDDGFDIDEAGPGDIRATITNSNFDGNRDEGVDLDEAGPGHGLVTFVNSTADGNEDEGFKLDEDDAGNVRVTMRNSSTSDAASQEGVQIEELGDGSLNVSISRHRAVGNDNEGVQVESAGEGRSVVRIVGSDLRDNGDGPVDVDADRFTYLNTMPALPLS